MLKWIERLLAPPCGGFKVVEIDAPAPKLDAATFEEAIQSLGAHPGFVALLARLRAQSAALETQLRRSFHENLRSVDVLQAGIYWSRWLEQQLKTQVYKTKQTISRDAIVEEETAFREALAAMELVGKESSS